jgi:ribosomal-protein-serine acetyltransferase
MRTEIYDEQIILKAYEESFAPMLFEAARESGASLEFRRWMPWCHENYTLAESREFVEKCAQNRRDSENVWRAGMEFGYAIFDRASGRFLGGTGINQPNEPHKFFNLGYWVRTRAQNRGVASRATRILARAAFEDLPVNRIEIIVAAGNVPSRKAAEKAGARFEGILRNRLLIGAEPHDAAMFSFIKEDFQS